MKGAGLDQKTPFQPPLTGVPRSIRARNMRIEPRQMIGLLGLYRLFRLDFCMNPGISISNCAGAGNEAALDDHCRL